MKVVCSKSEYLNSDGGGEEIIGEDCVLGIRGIMTRNKNI